MVYRRKIVFAKERMHFGRFPQIHILQPVSIPAFSLVERADDVQSLACQGAHQVPADESRGARHQNCVQAALLKKSRYQATLSDNPWVSVYRGCHASSFRAFSEERY